MKNLEQKDVLYIKCPHCEKDIDIIIQVFMELDKGKPYNGKGRKRDIILRSKFKNSSWKK